MTVYNKTESIWYGQVDLQMLNQLMANTMGEALGIKFTEIGPDHLRATMPVNSKTKQPFGLLHGGASVALAETIGSVASWCMINRDIFMGVGLEINANHLKPVTEGFVTAVCSPLKSTGRIHVWEIKIWDDKKELSCICRFTSTVVPLRK
jgi:1,4-dihydroxy-2-naphthoyl-CoA hydrolase